MEVVRREIVSKAVLTRTGIPGHDWCLNPYVGCEHGCSYCYASFMKRFTGHLEPWGGFVDAKVNAPEVLRRQLRRVRGGSVLVGTVTDPYQPLERRYRLTRGCLEALADGPGGLEVSVLTRSPLCLRDVDVFRRFGRRISVGLSITTDDDRVRRTFEPHAPPIGARVEALKALRAAGVPTHAFAGPLLPMDPARYVELIGDAAGEVLVDRMNYSGKVVARYRRAELERYLEDAWFDRTAAELERGFARRGVAVDVLFQGR
ncbi:MAG TPA: radical SAM protein [Anaeromyxobacter sp.]|nr:radical SAM protein [Anaeromyxobacter sp.]